MVPSQPFEVGMNGSGNLFRVFHSQKVTDDLRVMLGLARKAQRRVFLFGNLRIGHHLNDLGWLGDNSS